jgi:hypothetical protein
MAIKVAGKKPVGAKKIRIINETEIELPKNWEETIHQVLDHLPVEHRRGIENLKLVDFINDPRVKDAKVDLQGDLPGLYHPKMQNKSARMEISAGALLKPFGKWSERWMAKTSFKSNLAGLIFSLVGQHYYLTMKHSVKKQNLEGKIRKYAETNLREWSEQQSANSWRGKLFKPIRPLMERWAKWLNKKAAQKK